MHKVGISPLVLYYNVVGSVRLGRKQANLRDLGSELVRHDIKATILYSCSLSLTIHFILYCLLLCFLEVTPCKGNKSGTS